MPQTAQMLHITQKYFNNKMIKMLSETRKQLSAFTTQDTTQTTTQKCFKMLTKDGFSNNHRNLQNLN